jgi:hypothetical protein
MAFFCMHVVLYWSVGFEIPIHSTLSITPLLTFTYPLLSLFKSSLTTKVSEALRCALRHQASQDPGACEKVQPPGAYKGRFSP